MFLFPNKLHLHISTLYSTKITVEISSMLWERTCKKANYVGANTGRWINVAVGVYKNSFLIASLISVNRKQGLHLRVKV